MEANQVMSRQPSGQEAPTAKGQNVLRHQPQKEKALRLLYLVKNPTKLKAEMSIVQSKKPLAKNHRPCKEKEEMELSA